MRRSLVVATQPMNCEKAWQQEWRTQKVNHLLLLSIFFNFPMLVMQGPFNESTMVYPVHCVVATKESFVSPLAESLVCVVWNFSPVWKLHDLGLWIMQCFYNLLPESPWSQLVPLLGILAPFPRLFSFLIFIVTLKPRVHIAWPYHEAYKWAVFRG